MPSLGLVVLVDHRFIHHLHGNGLITAHLHLDAELFRKRLRVKTTGFVRRHHRVTSIVDRLLILPFHQRRYLDGFIRQGLFEQEILNKTGLVAQQLVGTFDFGEELFANADRHDEFIQAINLMGRP